ncbi:LysM peptidoglycan-binding domain-containing protein [Microbacterium sp. STF-2]|uniref:LysM peptidoglycan-binding domain-containing protein n=1 Tax=unclassified Microbacterium TaxID=2609290 RepID=UPI0026347101|nr:MULTISPECIES: LysM peptidoglycan-binding domain-containing protein [unclassified Microbacterium]MCV0335668.1 LysM peptidoglycan-binding domain-containing protein [Microbacterium sp.]MCV0376926.1 LysM peptidoglycan-binding domain-containing protein [Microbacterium sp.]MCV0390687.1 LysM peptidoglycan-binding domain-containing protein [Microbacterium sp.]MCV0418422.1 LysM peptidoglycan-binding domain-containing protein [Microbacterium sp.]MCV0421910.1 LysM peptidoglycan-binding domain-containi
MSSISFSTAAVIPASTRPSTRLRLTTRGRAVLLAFASVPLAIGIAFAALSGGSAIASGADSAAVSVETVTVMPGDTLWSIATSVAPDADPRDVIGEISRMNLLRGGELQIGQTLAIPAQYVN